LAPLVPFDPGLATFDPGLATSDPPTPTRSPPSPALLRNALAVSRRANVRASASVYKKGTATIVTVPFVVELRSSYFFDAGFLLFFFLAGFFLALAFNSLVASSIFFSIS